MSGQIGSVSQFQVQPSIIRQNPQQDVQQRPVSSETQNNSNAQVAQANANQDFVQLAQDVIAQRAAAPVESQAVPPQRGEIVNLLV